MNSLPTQSPRPTEPRRGEFRIREAVAADIPALAALHVRTWNDTYPDVQKKPTYEIRERQWCQAFAQDDGSWFCFVVEEPNSDLIAFAKGMAYYSSELPNFDGELNKLYVHRDYHRRGLGRLLVGHVARRFLQQGIDSMLLFADAQNPSCGFYERLGAEKLLDRKGKFHGGYGWRNLLSLAAACLPD
jgi:ribosomal protein S18 acetylase RimI-like enzyme